MGWVTRAWRHLLVKLRVTRPVAQVARPAIVSPPPVPPTDAPAPRPFKPNPFTAKRREIDAGARILRYKQPTYDRRGDLLSPTAEAKRALRAEFIRMTGREPTPKQLKQFRRQVREAIARFQAQGRGVVASSGTGGEAA